jgi:hypothetical protein
LRDERRGQKCQVKSGVVGEAGDILLADRHLGGDTGGGDGLAGHVEGAVEDVDAQTCSWGAHLGEADGDPADAGA